MVFKKKKKPAVKTHISNPDLITIKPGWKGTPLDQNGLFIYEEHPTILSGWDVLKFMLQPNPQKQEKKADTWRIKVRTNDGWLTDPADKIVWLGHASFFIQLSGVRILIDPVFGNLPIGRRYSALPVAPEKLLNIDYILISHAHYDHCDKKSVQLLSANCPAATILVGLKLDRLVSKWVDSPIISAGWYQQYPLNDPLTITYLPSRHWANRNPFDASQTLWGSFMVQSAGKSIYFGGDSGHGSHFRDIGKLFPQIDVALIGTGAYSPAWFMAQHHQDPYDAVKAFHALGAATMIPFHYGTFDSADEPMGEPEVILNRLNCEEQIDGSLKILELGEVFDL